MPSAKIGHVYSGLIGLIPTFVSDQLAQLHLMWRLLIPLTDKGRISGVS